MRFEFSVRFWFLVVLTVLLANSVLPITADEAYYLSWSRTLSWGYFDHPPLVAWVASISRAFAPRIPFTLLVLLPIFAIRDKGMYPVLLAVPGAHLLLGGVLPDTLMVVSGFALLWSFRRWEKNDTLPNALLVGLGLGLLGLSKYHGVLLVVALAFGYWPLRKRKSLYVAIGFGALLLLPHLWWQYQHDWVTFRYHLQGRFVTGKPWYELVGVFALLGVLWWPVVVRFKSLPRWAQALSLMTVGLMLWAGIRGSVEVHWSLVLLWVVPSIPADVWKLAKFRTLVPALALVFAVLHLLFVVPGIRTILGLNTHFRTEVAAIEEEGDVVFLNSYQDAALYEYYHKTSSYALMHPGIRLSQFNLRPYPFPKDTVSIYNRAGLGQQVPGTPFSKMTRVVDDLSSTELTQGEDGRWSAADVPDGYQWVAYSYQGRTQLERNVLGPADQSVKFPELVDGVELFVTLEKRWVPSQLWVDVRELGTKKIPYTSQGRVGDSVKFFGF